VRSFILSYRLYPAYHSLKPSALFLGSPSPLPSTARQFNASVDR
jgi:hypothetical protein